MKNVVLTLLIVLGIAAVPSFKDMDPQGSLYRIARGDLRAVCHGGGMPNVTCVHKFGHNKDVDIGTETVWDGGGSYTIPSGAELINVVSTDVNDDVGDTGARYVQIFGLDSNYDEVQLVVALNGTSNVPTTTALIAINRAVVISAGTSTYNEGTLTFTQVTSGLVLAEIDPQIAITEQVIYTVPNGKELYIYSLDFTGTKTGGGANPLLTVDLDYYDPNLSVELDPTTSGVNINLFENQLDTAVDNHRHERFVAGGAIREHSTVLMRATTDQNNTVVYGSFWGVLVDTE